jgi:crotonobetainyl-CoA:carnitine CoA-transferase CaiB-like acyl-CoA transferase
MLFYPGVISLPKLKILSGIRVLGFTQFLLGPAAIQYLADLGADVVKVEPPGKGAWERSWSGADTYVNGVSVFYALAHRNVRSVTLNLKHPQAKEVLGKLLAWSDVVVQNFRPRVAHKLGLDYEAVREINPSVIYVSISGYGEKSPYAELPGQDLLIQAVSGLISVTGRAGEIPCPAGAPVVDQHGAALAAMAVLAALFHRERTGEGQKIEVTMLEAALDLQLEPFSYWLNGGILRRPWTALGSTFHHGPYGVYPTRDGYIVLALGPIKKLYEILGNPPELEPLQDPNLAFDKREEIYRALGEIIRQRSTKEWVDYFNSNDFWAAPVNSYKDLVEDPSFQYLNPVHIYEHPRAGTLKLLKHPVRYSSGEAEVRFVAPDLGEHTEEVLSEVGFSGSEIASLRQKGVI